MELTNMQWCLRARPDGPVRESDFELVVGKLPQIGPGEILCETAFLSVAPVMRLYMLNATAIEPPLALGDVMHGRGVGKVIASRHPEFVIGDIVQGRFGWQQFARLSGKREALTFKVTQNVAPISTALGPLGMTGWTAWVGLKEIGRLKTGQTLVVSGAAGGVGSIVGPIAANLGAHAIGIASSDEKCTLLTERLGYKAAINYRTQNVEARLQELCPEGINVFFDNVGGPILDAALANLAQYGRVVLCGRISQYLLGTEETYRLTNWGQIGAKRATMEAFFIYDYAHHFLEAENTMAGWIANGSLPYAEDISDGIETLPAALVSLFSGTNLGKRLVRVKSTVP
jgi:NADPH-dependent curcumin reductase